MKVTVLFEKVKERLAESGRTITRDEFLVQLGGWAAAGEIVIEGGTCRLMKNIDVTRAVTESVLGVEDEPDKNRVG